MILTSGQAGNPLKAVDKTVENLPTLIDRMVFPGFQGGPHMNNIAALAVALGEADTPEFKVYARQILKNAKALAAELMTAGCKLITNGTDNHLMLIDCVKSFGAGGKEIQEALDKIGITLNKNAIADDTLPPYAPSGIRLGTPAMTTRGVDEKGFKKIAGWIVEGARARSDETKLKELRAQVREFCLQYPVPGID